MAVVTLEGIFMGASAKTSTFEGREKTSIYIDVYQPDSTENEKTVKIKSDDLTLLNRLNKDFIMGVPFSCKAGVNAYKNQAYYKLVSL